MLTDDQLGPAFLHNLEYAFGTVIGKILISLLLAVLLLASIRNDVGVARLGPVPDQLA